MCPCASPFLQLCLVQSKASRKKAGYPGLPGPRGVTLVQDCGKCSKEEHIFSECCLITEITSIVVRTASLLINRAISFGDRHIYEKKIISAETEEQMVKLIVEAIQKIQHCILGYVETSQVFVIYHCHIL